MSDQPSLPPENHPPTYVAPQYQPGMDGQPVRPPFSKLAIGGFILSVVGLFIFGFLGFIGVLLSRRALHAIRLGTARGRGLAIAGLVIGIVAAIVYIIQLILRAIS